jgi:hypothetical protein
MDEIILCTRGGGRKEGIASSENAKANGLSTLVQQAVNFEKRKRCFIDQKCKINRRHIRTVFCNVSHCLLLLQRI